MITVHTLVNTATDLYLVASAPTPTPTGGATIPDDDSVTPGLIGFLVTFGIMVIVVLLALDLVRRVRRVNYRAEIQARLEEERVAADGENDESTATSRNRSSTGSAVDAQDGADRP